MNYYSVRIELSLKFENIEGRKQSLELKGDSLRGVLIIGFGFGESEVGVHMCSFNSNFKCFFV